VWDWFCEILDGCVAGFGPAQVSWQDLACWSALTGEAPEPWEARAIVRLGATRAAILSEDVERSAKQEAKT
jgi:hypothetical protein